MRSDHELGMNLRSAARLISDSEYVVCLVGAGISVESGIPPFRGTGGLWTRIGEPAMDGYQRFLNDPEGHWKDMLSPDVHGPTAEFRDAMLKAVPNEGHFALAALEHFGILRYIITQNVDSLHQQAGSLNIAEIHGNRYKLRCIGCNRRWLRDDFHIVEIPPRCFDCGSLVKGDGVAFGEPIPADVLSVCQIQTSLCDCMILIGTSGLVYPAASFPIDAKAGGAHLIEVNTDNTALSAACDFVLTGTAGYVLRELVSQIKETRSKNSITLPPES